LTSGYHAGNDKGNTQMPNTKIVLFADDEQLYLEPLKIKVEVMGYRVLAATTVAEAIALLRSNSVAVLVLDIMMDPGGELMGQFDVNLAGFQALDLIKKVSPNTQVICLSVLEDPAVLKELKKRGIVFLGKGETSLRKTASVIESKVTGIIRDSDLRSRRGRKWDVR